MNEILKNFGSRVKQLRRAQKLTQDQFAQKTGLHKNYIGMVERGERNPSLENINIIAEAFGVSLSELFQFS
jgi:transcriptional regulator with XRE-family HTH domain